MTRDPLFVLAVLALSVALAEWLARNTVLRHVGSALLVIVIAAVFANTGLIPAYDPEGGTPVYDGVFAYGVYIGVFWLLLLVNLRDLARAGGKMLALFAIGAMGTVAGVVVGMAAVDGSATIGEHWRAVGGMFVGTYTGGSANLNLLAAEHGVNKAPNLYVGINAVDAILTTFYMVATIALPRLLRRWLPGRARPVVGEPTGAEAAPASDGAEDTERVGPMDLGLVLALGIGGLWLATVLTGALNGWLAAGVAEGELPPTVPKALVLTTIALVLAQVPGIGRLPGLRALGMFAVMLFLAVIGCLCDLAALDRLGELALVLWAFAAIVIAVHALVVFGLAGLFRLDWDMAAVASQANVGGGTTAIALARGLGRGDLVLPGILIGSLGTAVGTYLGELTIRHLL